MSRPRSWQGCAGLRSSPVGAGDAGLLERYLSSPVLRGVREDSSSCQTGRWERAFFITLSEFLGRVDPGGCGSFSPVSRSYMPPLAFAPRGPHG